MIRSSILTACLFTALFSQAHAQTDEERKVLAAGPLIVNPLPSSARWTEDYAYTDTAKGGESPQVASFKAAAIKDPSLAKLMADPNFVFALKNIRPQHILITQTGAIRHEEKTLEQGYRAEVWRNDAFEVERPPNSAKLSARAVTGSSAANFVDIGWISSKNFAGIKEESGRKGFLFKENRYDDHHEFVGTAYAFIDVDTRYPVSFHFNNTTIHYTFFPPPTAPLTIPTEFTAAGTAMVAGIRKSMPPASHP